MKKLVLVGVVLGCAASICAATNIEPYASGAFVRALVGQEATVSGIYYRDVFAAPVVMIKGHRFYLLQDPPSKGAYKFPSKARPATVTGTLYYYDSDRANDAEYAAIDSSYFYFKVDASDLRFEEAEVAEGQRTFMKTWKYNLAYTRKAAGIRGEDLSMRATGELGDAEIDEALYQSTYSIFLNGRLEVAEDSVTMMIPDLPYAPTDLEVKSISGNVLKGSVTEPLLGTYDIEMEILEDGKLKYSVFGIFEDGKWTHLYFDP